MTPDEALAWADSGTCTDWCTRAALKALAAEVRRLREERRWIPCSERLPEHDDWYLVSSNEWRPPRSYVLEFRGCEHPIYGAWIANGDFRGHVTHWQPIPEGPGRDG